ncbi:MAG: low molecular weight protein arginine phosphatase [Anaerolineae bacterium]|nr:low molecular weight protein arginine phosphatase [Anaerolineae bacterium]
MPHILFICTANICRSPVAEGLLRQRLQESGLDAYEVSSAGTWAQLRRGAASTSITLMAERDIDISSHRAREVSAEVLEEADLILCMESGHAEALRVEFPEAAERIYLLSEMSGGNQSISDPYGGPVLGYARMIDEVSFLIDAGLPRIIGLAGRFAYKRQQ